MSTMDFKVLEVLGNQPPFSLCSKHSRTPEQRAFRILAAGKLEREQKLNKVGGGGQERERLPTNPWILKNTHLFSQLNSFIHFDNLVTELKSYEGVFV